MRMPCSALDVHGDQLFMDQRVAGRCQILPSALCNDRTFCTSGYVIPNRVRWSTAITRSGCAWTIHCSSLLHINGPATNWYILLFMDWTGFLEWVAWLDKDTDLISWPDVMQRLESPSCSMVWSKSLIPEFLVCMHGFPLLATSYLFSNINKELWSVSTPM